MADNKIEIEIVLDDGTIKKGFATINNEAKKSAKEVSDSFSVKNLIGGVAIGTALGNIIVSGFRSAFSGIRNIISGSLDEAIEGQFNLQKLNSALINTGQFSKETSSSLNELASQLQAASSFTDDAVLSTESLLINLGRLSAEQIPAATKAALDLASALDIDLNAAATLVGKAAQGNIESFTRYGLVIQKGATNAQTFSNVLTALNEKFSGTAAREVNTFAGSTKQLSNAFNDAKQSIGDLIINSPTVIALFKTITENINKFSKSIGSLKGSGDIFTGISDGLFFLGNVTIQFVIRPFEVLINVMSTLFRTFLTLFSASAAIATGVVAGIGKALNALGIISDETAKKIQAPFDTAFQSMKDNASAAIENVKTAIDQPFSDNLSNGLVDLKTQLETVREQIRLTKEEASNNNNNNNNDKKIIEPESLTVIDSFNAVIDGSKQRINELSMTAREGFAQVGKSAIDSLGRAVGGAFASMGAAFANGENGLKAFVKSFLGAVGQIAVQLGTELILRGIAYSLDPFTATIGPPLIAAGAALATFGGVLSAFGGGGAPTASGAVGAQTQGQGLNNETFEPVQEKPKTEIAVNILGNVLDRRETGLEITRILQENFDSNDLIMTRA